MPNDGGQYSDAHRLGQQSQTRVQDRIAAQLLARNKGRRNGQYQKKTPKKNASVVPARKEI